MIEETSLVKSGNSGFTRVGCAQQAIRLSTGAPLPVDLRSVVLLSTAPLSGVGPIEIVFLP